MARLAVIATHPIQYYAPWFQHIVACTDIDLKVFYLWKPGGEGFFHPGFLQSICWDMPLLSGYAHEFVPNESRDPGTHHFRGLVNRRLRECVETFRPDAVLMTAYKFASTLAFLMRWDRSRVPLLFRGDSHRLLPDGGIRQQLRGFAITSIFRRFVALLYVGQANYRYFRQHGVPAECLHFAPHAVDNARFMAAAEPAQAEAAAWRRELGIAEANALIVFAGKFEEKKRPQDLLEAFLAAGLPGTDLLFVGAGPLEETLRASALGRADVHFAPLQNQSQMPRTYAAADLFVLPSYGPWETWGLAINEALCMGCPVVVSDHVGCAQDLVQPGANGLVFPAGDVPALEYSLRDALSDRGRLRRWGEEGRRIVARYSYAQTTAGLLAALRALGIPAEARA
ncbi:MAG: glycosyltransferase family 4 protein [Burkholderiales bacterium]|nr:glycosyltransferase family 4 protein [Burkholderiales bacterium]